MLGRFKRGAAADDLGTRVVTLTDEDDFTNEPYLDDDEDNSNLHAQFGHLVTPEQIAAHEREVAE